MTIVECKLWKNPEALRKVVAQSLHYVSALADWSYSDLQREVSKATDERGNHAYQLVRERTSGKLTETAFVNAASRSLREGRFLVLIVGDGVQEGVQSIAELLRRNATKAFSFGLIEVALYRFADDQLIIQPRVLAQTELIERQVTVLNASSNYLLHEEDSDEDEKEPQNGSKMHLKAWWQPILDMKFDDPDQEPPYWTGVNNAILNTPFPGIQIKAYARVAPGSGMGVFVSGPRGDQSVQPIRKFIRRESDVLKRELPAGTDIDSKASWPIILYTSDYESDSDKWAWLKKTLNEFVNVLRPRLKAWYEETTR